MSLMHLKIYLFTCYILTKYRRLPSPTKHECSKRKHPQALELFKLSDKNHFKRFTLQHTQKTVLIDFISSPRFKNRSPHLSFIISVWALQSFQALENATYVPSSLLRTFWNMIRQRTFSHAGVAAFDSFRGQEDDILEALSDCTLSHISSPTETLTKIQRFPTPHTGKLGITEYLAFSHSSIWMTDCFSSIKEKLQIENTFNEVKKTW